MRKPLAFQVANEREVASFGRIWFVFILLSGVPWGGWLLLGGPGGCASPLGALGVGLLEVFLVVVVLLDTSCGGRVVDRGVGVGGESCTAACGFKAKPGF